ncbi:HAD-IIB family hydrolase [Bacillus sp. JCM 19041]|uniref:HAD-IIB family hydrolase n=1 Tax=Bacillus sp. JCM 19041 TaxID=1460637 RepID=UPI000A59221F
MNSLIAIDLDGTLLADDGTISARNAQAIRKAQEGGSVVSICSGRSLHDTKAILEEAKLECPMITGNGAITFHDGEQIQALSMESALLEELLPQLESENYYYELYTNDGVYLFERGKGMLEREIEEKAGSDKSFSTDWGIHEMNIQFEQKGTRHITDYRDFDLSSLAFIRFLFSRFTGKS